MAKKLISTTCWCNIRKHKNQFTANKKIRDKLKKLKICCKMFLVHNMNELHIEILHLVVFEYIAVQHVLKTI